MTIEYQDCDFKKIHDVITVTDEHQDITEIIVNGKTYIKPSPAPQ